MKKFFGFTMLVSAIAIVLFSLAGFVQQQEPWRVDQLLNPADLAATIRDKAAPKPVIISVGPGAVIANSIEVGQTNDPANLKRLESELKKLPKDADVVIYCGCCPFNRCPNIRPAFSLMNNMGFKNHKLLNLTQNVKTDWIDHGYPVVE